MKKSLQPIKTFLQGPEAQWLHPRTGRIVAPERVGEVWVAYDGSGPFEARLLAGVRAGVHETELREGSEVLLVFDGGDPSRPIVVGVLENTLERLVAMDPKGNGEAAEKEEPCRTVLDADDEMVIRCGEGSITLKKEGKIVIRGTEIVSRASGRNKIKGGSVELN